MRRECSSKMWCPLLGVLLATSMGAACKEKASVTLVTREGEATVPFKIQLPKSWQPKKTEKNTNWSTGKDPGAEEPWAYVRVYPSRIENVSQDDLESSVSIARSVSEYTRIEKLPNGSWVKSWYSKLRLNEDNKPTHFQVEANIKGKAGNDFGCDVTWNERPFIKDVKATQKLLERICLSVKPL